MKVALIGYGKMGRAVEEAATEKNHSIASRVSPDTKGADFAEITKESLANADVCIDFSHPDAVIDNVKAVASQGLNLVIGTTGWYDRLDEIEAIAKEYDTGIIYAANFSIGVQAFCQIIEHAAKIFQKLEHYDVAGMEIHHNKKVDNPSGTAKVLGQILLDNIDRKKKLVNEMGNRAMLPEELHFSSVRCGSDPGHHSIHFDSNADSLILTHKARNRNGFAEGAVVAAEWIKGRKGVFSMQDMMHELIN